MNVQIRNPEWCLLCETSFYIYFEFAFIFIYSIFILNSVLVILLILSFLSFLILIKFNFSFSYFSISCFKNRKKTQKKREMLLYGLADLKLFFNIFGAINPA